MRLMSGLAMIAALAATDASAQGVNLTGQFRCVQLCSAGLQGQPASSPRTAETMNLLNEAGEPSRAWIDLSGHIWAENLARGRAFFLGWDGRFNSIVEPSGNANLGEPPAATPDRRSARRSARVEHTRVEPARIEPSRIEKTGKRVSAPIRAGRRRLRLPPPRLRRRLERRHHDPKRRLRPRLSVWGADRQWRRRSTTGGGPVDLQGHVYSNGSVRVRVSGAGQEADGQGRLSRTLGTVTWHGQGSLGSCAGVWQAERRGIEPTPAPRYAGELDRRQGGLPRS